MYSASHGMQTCGKDAMFVIARAVREEKPVMRKSEGIICQMTAQTKDVIHITRSCTKTKINFEGD